MVIKKGNKLVELKQEVVERINKELEKNTRNIPDFTNYVNTRMNDLMLKDEFLSKAFPNLEYAGCHESSIFIKCNKENQVAIITLKEDKLHCSIHGLKYCEHNLFALGLTDLARLLL